MQVPHLDWIIFFFLYSLSGIPVFLVYGYILLLPSKLNKVCRITTAIISYLMMMGFILSPFKILQYFQVQIPNSGMPSLVFAVLYVSAFIPGIVFFKKRYLRRLHARGMFLNNGRKR